MFPQDVNISMALFIEQALCIITMCCHNSESYLSTGCQWGSCAVDSCFCSGPQVYTQKQSKILHRQQFCFEYSTNRLWELHFCLYLSLFGNECSKLKTPLITIENYFCIRKRKAKSKHSYFTQYLWMCFLHLTYEYRCAHVLSFG